ncbi:hypothetical protein ACF1AY_35170 [Streptomyces sp. NPDC014776]|uniref:hypothetical protein n=1 Tax=unclassified Streptomyces TaxID=2593676 RepID=UPI0037005F7D
MTTPSPVLDQSERHAHHLSVTEGDGARHRNAAVGECGDHSRATSCAEGVNPPSGESTEDAVVWEYGEFALRLVGAKD